LISFAMRKDEYRGNLKKFLDDTHENLNKQWNSAQGRVYSIATNIEVAINYLITNFGTPSKVGRRWKDRKYESTINRAVLDVQVAMVMSEHNRIELLDAGVSFENVLKDLCENSSDFVESIAGTTKSLGAIKTRYELWEEGVNSAADKKLSIK
jgi:hypothetical protein